jgi:hypothetical protein
MNTEPTTEKIERIKFPVWSCAGSHYWSKPVKEGDAARGIPTNGGKRIVINARCGSDFSYDRIYIEAGYVHALTLGLAADFDAGKF